MTLAGQAPVSLEHVIFILIISFLIYSFIYSCFSKDEAAKGTMVRNLKNTSTASSKLLLAAKSLVTDPNAPNAKNALANAAR